MDGALVERWARARRDPTLAVLEGFHPLKHALGFGAEVVEVLVSEPERVLALAATLAPDGAERLRRLPLTAVPAEALAALATMPLRSPVLALARRPYVDPGALLGGGEGPLILLDQPTHLGNVGAAVRAAAAAGADGLLTSGPHDPWHVAALRGSAGLHFALPVARVGPNWQSRRPLIALDPGGEPLRTSALPDDALLLFGSERRGLSKDLLARSCRRFALPMRAGVSSLNLATTVAAVLYAWRLARGA